MRVPNVSARASLSALSPCPSCSPCSLRVMRARGVFALCLVLVAWFWVLKIRLRLAGKEPEANIFSVDDVFAAARNPKGVKQCMEKVELKHLSPEGRVYYRVFNSTAVPYEVILGYRDFKAGASVDDVVRGCNCMDFVKRGGVCKHAGACCLHLLRNTASLASRGHLWRRKAFGRL